MKKKIKIKACWGGSWWGWSGAGALAFPLEEEVGDVDPIHIATPSP